IPIEAALMARRIAPGLEREFAFQQWAQYDAAAWEEIRDEAASTVLRSAGVTIIASDRDAGAVAATLSNAERAGVAEDIDVRRCSISEMEPPPSASGWLVTNPPYGVRVSDSSRLFPLYSRLGDLLRDRCAGWSVVMLTADPRMERATKLSLSELFRTRNGGIPVRCMTARVPARASAGREHAAEPAN